MRSPRDNKVTILLNEKEQRLLDSYCAKYNITNRSRLIRETLIRSLLAKLESDEPTLFD